jgi:hypothetical protein
MEAHTLYNYDSVLQRVGEALAMRADRSNASPSVLTSSLRSGLSFGRPRSILSIARLMPEVTSVDSVSTTAARGVARGVGRDGGKSRLRPKPVRDPMAADARVITAFSRKDEATFFRSTAGPKSFFKSILSVTAGSAFLFSAGSNFMN